MTSPAEEEKEEEEERDAVTRYLALVVFDLCMRSLPAPKERKERIGAEVFGSSRYLSVATSSIRERKGKLTASCRNAPILTESISAMSLSLDSSKQRRVRIFFIDKESV